MDGPSHSKECRERFEMIFEKEEEEEEKALMDAAAATAASMAHQDEVATSSTNPDTAVHPGTVPMNVEFPKEAVVPEQEARHLRECQFVQTPGGMEISEADLKCSEFDRKVRRINGLVVCSMDIVGAAQADYDNPQFSGEEIGRLMKSRTRCIRTMVRMKSLEVPISERDIIGAKSGVVLGRCRWRGKKKLTVLQDTRCRVGKDERVQTGWCSREA